MDDFDKELFGPLLKTQKKKSNSRSIDFDEFNDDDPLVGLLGLSDSEDEIKVKGPSNKQPVNASGRKSKAIVDDDADAALTLPDSPRTRRPRSIMDDLLAKSDVIQQTQPAPVQREFVLDESYRHSTEGSRRENVDEDRLGYLPTASSSQITFGGAGSGPKTASVIGRGDSVGPQPVGLSIGRTGRRGISATIESNDSLDDKRPLSSTPAPTPTTRSRRQLDTDWLELKPPAPAEAASPAITSNNLNAGEQGRSRSAAAKSEKEIGVRVDWLGIDDDHPGHEREKVITNNNVRLSTTVEPKKDSFMNWLDRAKPAEPELKIATPSEGLPAKAPDNPARLTAPLPEFGHEVSELTADYEKRLSTFKTKMAEVHLKFSEESLNASANVFDLQTKVRRLEFDRDQLQRSLEGLEKRHREELDALETSFKKRIQLTEESYQRREQRLQEELDSFTKAQVEKQSIWDRDRAELVASWQRKLDESINDRMNDLDRLKDLHGRTLADMKRDHDVAIGRLQKIKNVEVDAMNEATSHSKTLQLVIDQLRSNTTELSQLQLKVEGNNVSGLEEREMLLETKDRQLKAVHDQLQKQREQNEQERTLLRQLIARLEDKLQQQTGIQEEESWKLSQERNKLETEKNVFDESRKAMSVQLDREKLQLQKAREQFLVEQKEILEHVYGENQRLLSSGGVQSRSQSIKPVPNNLSPDVSNSFQSLKAQIVAEGTLNAMHEERARLDERMTLLNSDKQFLDTQKLQLETERSAINALALQVKQRSEEVEEMCLCAVQTREEGYASLQEAKRLQLDVRKRQDSVAADIEALKTRECQLAKERLNLGRQRSKLEKLSSSTSSRLLCARCGSNAAASSAMDIGDGPSTSTFTKTPVDDGLLVRKLEPMFVAWQISARKDQDFLNRESVFLKELRANQRTANNVSAPL